MKLTVQHLHNATTFTCQLQPPGGTIGRGQHNDVNLPDPSGELSTLQAIVRLDESRGAATVLNMSSMGRVAVNDTPLGLSQESTVNHGDSISVGDYQITFGQSQASSDPAERIDHAALSATPYDTAAFAGGASATGTNAATGASAATKTGTTAATIAATGMSAQMDINSASNLSPATGINAATGTASLQADSVDDSDKLPTWHPAYQPPAETSDDGTQADPFAHEHPLGTPINRMPPPAPAANTTVAPLYDHAATPEPSSPNTPLPNTNLAQADDGAPAAPPVPEDNPDDIFKDLLSGPGVLPVGATAADERHPFDMESAANRNHHNPVELLKPQGMQHPSIDGDPLAALPSDGTDKDRYTIFSDDSPTTLNKDTALDSHKEDNILETLRRAAHAGYPEKDKDSDDK